MFSRPALALALFAAVACDNKNDRPNDNPPPPPMASAKPGACASGGGSLGDPASEALFPGVIAGYCIDPQSPARVYGDKGKLSMDDVCTTAMDGECEVYKGFGLSRYVAMQYVDGGAGGGVVQVSLSQFKDADGAYGMFTKRVVAGGDPLRASAPRPLAAGAAAVMGTGTAYVWKGSYLAELAYSNEQESPDQLARSSEAIVSALAKDIGSRLPGAANKPAAAERLPTANLVPNGIEYVVKDTLGVHGVGPAAMGYYKDGDTRWRIVTLAFATADKSKDAFKAFRATPGALPVANLGDEAARVTLQSSKESPKTEWVIARKGSLVVGAGDEAFEIHADEPAEKQARARLSKDDAMAKVRAVLGP